MSCLVMLLVLTNDMHMEMTCVPSLLHRISQARRFSTVLFPSAMTSSNISNRGHSVSLGLRIKIKSNQAIMINVYCYISHRDLEIVIAMKPSLLWLIQVEREGGLWQNPKEKQHLVIYLAFIYLLFI